MAMSGRFVESLPQEDDWHGVLDPKKRKQIQDRLAQRARRRRLAEARPPKQKCIASTERARRPSRLTRPNGHRGGGPGSATDDIEQHNHAAIVPEPPEPQGLASSSPATTSDVHCTLLQRTEQPFLSALFDNGRLLGLSCGSSFPSKSKPVGPEVPASLRPTLLQRSTVHWQWIDRFPFARSRDELIIQSGAVDEEAFLADLFHAPSFVLTPGATSWDPAAYTICPHFKAKWGFLFPDFSDAHDGWL